jgi:hypothetical protein
MVTGENGQTCLHKAATVGNFDLVKMITDAAAAQGPEFLQKVSLLIEEQRQGNIICDKWW